eukprot:Colp12_sorted_trinity150504_noHs@4251
MALFNQPSTLDLVNSIKVENDQLNLPTELPISIDRWLTNEELLLYLVAAQRNPNWIRAEQVLRPASGCIFIFDRKTVKFRQDGHSWKKRKDGKTVREDHMRLKVNKVEVWTLELYCIV